MLRTLVNTSIVLLLPSLLVLTGCDKATTPDPEPTKQDTAKQTAKAPDTKAKTPAQKPEKLAHKVVAKPPPPDPKKVDKAQAERGKKEFTAHVKAGRTAAKAKDYPTAIKEFEAAIKIEEKAGTLGELGWAHYNSGNLDDAEKVLTKAIAMALEDRTKGALLYNLGRVEEDKGEKDKAVSLYQKSISARPNKVVQARLDKLLAAGAHAEPDACTWQKFAGAPPTNLCQGFTPIDFGGLEFDCLKQDQEANGASKLLVDKDGVKATVFGSMIEEDYSTIYVLAVLRADAWYAYEFGFEDVGTGYRADSIELQTLELVDAIPGGKPELHIEWLFRSHQGDLEYNEMTFLSETYHGYVSLEQEAPQWIATIRSETDYSVEDYLDDDEFKSDKYSDEYGTKEKTGVEWTFTDSELTVTAKGKASAPAGTFKLADYPAKCHDFYGITSVQI